MTTTALDTARERQLDWLLDEVLGNRQPRAARRDVRAAMPRWLTAALVLLAIGASVGVALHQAGESPNGPAPAQENAPEIPWHDCTSPAAIDEVPADVINLRCYDFDDATLTRLAAFPKLQRLDLSKSLPDADGVTRTVNVTDAGVAQLAKLTNLRWLSLYGCWQIEGRTLSELRSIPQLEHLDLAHTNVKTSGVESLETLPSLRELVLSNCNEFHGSALASIARLPGLRRLELAACASLSAVDVQQLAKLSELLYLDLSDCCGSFLGQRMLGFDDFGTQQQQNAAKAEKEPVEDGIGVTDTTILALRELPLETLKLSGCTALTNQMLPGLAQMQSLRHLDLGNLPKTNTTLLHNLPKGLQSLSIRGNHQYQRAEFAPLMRTTFAQLPLTELDISGIPAIDDEILTQLIAGKRLRTLRIGGTPNARDAIGPQSHYLPAITARSAIEIAKQLELEELDLRATTWLDASSARELARLPSLQTLKLVYCTDLDADTLRVLDGTPLQNVDLYGTRIGDDDAIAIARSWPGCRARLPSGRMHNVLPD